MSDEGSVQPVAAPAAELNRAADNGTVDTKATDAPGSAAAEAKPEGANPTGEKAEKEAAEPAKEDETPKQAEGKIPPWSAPAPSPTLASVIIC